MDKAFPRTNVAGVSLSRMLIGTNWMLGWSHTSPAADKQITDKFSSPEAFFPLLDAFLQHGVDSLMGIIGEIPLMQAALRYAEDKTGKRIHRIDTPILNVDDSPAARKEAEAVVKRSAQAGSEFCLLHHSCAEQLVNKNRREIARLGDYTKMIRDAGMIPGLSAHMPELIVYSDANEYDVQTYVQLYNCMGFLMQVEVESVSGIIHSAKKPVMTIKSMAAGRVTPYVGLTFSFSTLRERDMVTVGCFTPNEVHEDVEIALAAIEHRFPDLTPRSSPNQNQTAITGKSE